MSKLQKGLLISMLFGGIVYAGSITNVQTIEKDNGVLVIKDINGTQIKNWVSAKDNYTIYKPVLFWQINKTNYTDYKKTGYKFTDEAPDNLDISYDDGLVLKRIDGTDDGYTTLWYDMGDLFKESRNMQITYDVLFKDNAKKGGINIGDIYLDINPDRVGFIGPNEFTGGISENEMHHVDIYINEVGGGKYLVKIYIDNVLYKEYVYDIPNFFDYKYIGLRSNYHTGTVVYSRLTVITQDSIKISPDETPINTYTISNGKEKFKYIYNGYYKPFGPKRGHWTVQLIGCDGDYSLVPTDNGGEKCEMRCTIGSSKIGYCKIK